MTCTHDAIKSVNCVFYCLKCGAQLPDNWLEYKNTGEKEKPAETPKNGRKRKAKKEVET